MMLSRQRLVKKIDPIEREKTVTEYVKYYEKHGMLMRDAKERLTQSYPFHPSLIDTLYDRVSTIPNFNQTRGMFRLLARIIRLIVNEKNRLQHNGIVRCSTHKPRDSR